jgi:hypothetical protein
VNFVNDPISAIENSSLVFFFAFEGFKKWRVSTHAKYGHGIKLKLSVWDAAVVPIFVGFK